MKRVKVSGRVSLKRVLTGRFYRIYRVARCALFLSLSLSLSLSFSFLQVRSWNVIACIFVEVITGAEKWRVVVGRDRGYEARGAGLSRGGKGGGG